MTTRSGWSSIVYSDVGVARTWFQSVQTGCAGRRALTPKETPMAGRLDLTPITGLKTRVLDALGQFVQRVENLSKEGQRRENVRNPQTSSDYPLATQLTTPWLMFLVMACRLDAAARKAGTDQACFNQQDCHLFLEDLRQTRHLSEACKDHTFDERGLEYTLEAFIAELAQLAMATASLAYAPLDC